MNIEYYVKIKEDLALKVTNITLGSHFRSGQY